MTEGDQWSEGVRLPNAPTAEEWEPFLRAERPRDDEPFVLTDRQVVRIAYIADSVLNGGPALEASRQQLAAVSTFLTALHAESRGMTHEPNSRDAWDRIEAMPYYLPSPVHLQKLESLRSRGLDPYGQPLPPVDETADQTAR